MTDHIEKPISSIGSEHLKQLCVGIGILNTRFYCSSNLSCTQAVFKTVGDDQDLHLTTKNLRDKITDYQYIDKKPNKDISFLL